MYPGYGLDDWGIIPGRDRDFSLHHHIQSTVHPDSCPMVLGAA